MCGVPFVTNSKHLQCGCSVFGQGRRGRHGHVAQLAQEVGRLEVGEQQGAAAALAGARRAADAVDVLRLVGRQTQLWHSHGVRTASDGSVPRFCVAGACPDSDVLDAADAEGSVMMPRCPLRSANPRGTMSRDILDEGQQGAHLHDQADVGVVNATRADVRGEHHHLR